MRMRNRVFPVLRRLLSHSSPLLNLLEAPGNKGHIEAGRAISPIFIIGPPRSGTTFLYQILSHSLGLEYIDNLAHLFYKNLKLGIQCSHLFFDEKPHYNFSSQGGNTLIGGWHAPSECPAFWYQAIPKKNHCVTFEELSEEQRKKLRNPIHAVMGKYQRPFLFKNLMVVERMQAVKGLFPHARFLVMKRDRVRTALSILKEREKLGISEDEWWSVRPEHYRELLELPLEQRVAAQVHYVEERIEKELWNVPADMQQRIRYEELVQDPQEVLRTLKEGMLNDTEYRTHPPSTPVKGGDTSQVPPERIEKVKEGFRKLGLPYDE